MVLMQEVGDFYYNLSLKLISLMLAIDNIFQTTLKPWDVLYKSL